MNTRVILYLLVVIFMSSCSQINQPITKVADYEPYLTAQPVSSYDLAADLAFWQARLERMPHDEASLLKLAGLHSTLFRKTGDVKTLTSSDSLYHHVLTTTWGKAGVYLALAQNAITRHEFRQAQKFAEAAREAGGRKAASLLVITDVALELGDVAQAKNILSQFTNQNSFAHRIRQVKVKDHEGDLDSAIIIMEQAFERIKGNKELYCWSLSNLADMYGHAGRIEDAYYAYLAVLQKEPSYDYALKGIAWIALSHDHNYAEAKRIITTLAARKRMPEAHLMLAEIAALENNETEKTNQLTQFVNLTNRADYKTMYAKYLANIYADDLAKPEVSLAIAEEEIRNRPTPQSYDLKAWALLQLGRAEDALLTANQHVQGKTFEPDAAYHLGMIYLANSQSIEAEKYLELALESSFELGPIVTRDIKNTLEKI
jgi:tetratricopeptide (TPR) repeat protein